MLKEYAKKAKERMKNGFWTEAKQSLEVKKQQAKQQGLDCVKVVEDERRKTVRRIYDEQGFLEEQAFYDKVVEILQSKDTVTNPLARLADKQLMQDMTPVERQTYLIKLSARFQKVVEQYNSSQKRFG
ncbi:MAG: hypothetical protein IKC47_05225 [Clostridia bacterium]|nr:hypothetical protein [Clostridia bacterium]